MLPLTCDIGVFPPVECVVFPQLGVYAAFVNLIKLINLIFLRPELLFKLTCDFLSEIFVLVVGYLFLGFLIEFIILGYLRTQIFCRLFRWAFTAHYHLRLIVHIITGKKI